MFYRNFVSFHVKSCTSRIKRLLSIYFCLVLLNIDFICINVCLAPYFFAIHLHLRRCRHQNLFTIDTENSSHRNFSILMLLRISSDDVDFHIFKFEVFLSPSRRTSFEKSLNPLPKSTHFTLALMFMVCLCLIYLY